MAAFTIDVEMDYGARTGMLRALDDSEGIRRLADVLAAAAAPASAFVVTSLLRSHPATIERLHGWVAEFHSHSHTHALGTVDDETELGASLTALRALNGGAVGYRSPQGRSSEGEIAAARRLGNAFSSTVFPTVRPGVFNHLDKPLTPFLHANGLLELPFAVVRGVRLVVSISYLKLVGWPVFRCLERLFGLPPVVVIDSHPHDTFATPALEALPPLPRLAWRVCRSQGIAYAQRLLGLLRRRGYEFVTIGELARRFSPPTEAAP